jgi:DNA-binding transcriptional LysR family regulator
MDLYHLWLFHNVSQNLSFTKTAEALHISQPTISMQVKKLEDEVGLKLFERYGRNIYLTQYGEILYSYSQKIFNLVEEMKAEIHSIKGEMFGKLNIGASNTPGIYILPDIMGTFKEKYPNVKTNLHIGNTYEIQSMMVLNQVDIAVIGGELDLPKSFYAEKLIDDLMVLVVSPNHPLANYDYIDRRLLANQMYIAHESNSNLYNAIEKIVKKNLKLPFNTAMTLGSVDAIKHAVAANLGISIVPLTSVKQDIQLGMLKRISVEGRVWTYPYNLVYYKDRNLTIPTKVMIQTIKEKIGRIVFD